MSTGLGTSFTTVPPPYRPQGAPVEEGPGRSRAAAVLLGVLAAVVVLAVGGLVLSMLDGSSEPTPAEPAPTAVVLREDFSAPSGAFGEYRTEGYECTVSDGAFVVTNSQEGYSIPSVTAIPFSDVVDVVATAWFVSDGGALDAAGVSVGRSDMDFYELEVSRALGVELYRGVPGEEGLRLLTSTQEAVDLSQRVQLRLTAATTSDGVQLTAYVDGEQVLTTTDPGRGGGFGEVGLVVYTNGSVTAAFDDLVVRAGVTS